MNTIARFAAWSALFICTAGNNCTPPPLSPDCLESIRISTTASTDGLIIDIKSASTKGATDTLRQLYPSLKEYWNSQIESLESDVANSWPDAPTHPKQSPLYQAGNNNNAMTSGPTGYQSFFLILTKYDFPPNYDHNTDRDTDRQLAYLQSLTRTPRVNYDDLRSSCNVNIPQDQFRSRFRMKRLPETFAECLSAQL